MSDPYLSAMTDAELQARIRTCQAWVDDFLNGHEVRAYWKNQRGQARIELDGRLRPQLRDAKRRAV
jgi:hypothetical protein